MVNVLAGLAAVASVSLIGLSFGRARAPMLALVVECSIYYSLSELYDSNMPTLRGAAESFVFAAAFGAGGKLVAPFIRPGLEKIGILKPAPAAESVAAEAAAIEGGSTSQGFLQKALKNQELDSVPNRMKEVWTEGDFRYTVRVHEGNPAYTNAESIYRVSRQSTVLDANGQGTGLQYLGTDGNWYPESVLKEFFKDGTNNPLFNEAASKMTHIPVNGGK